jgi:predicted transcriptional regulator
MAENNLDNLKIIFYPERAGLGKFWGKLEAEILEIIWNNGPMTVKRALFFISKSREYAYTTIMTVMNNLVKRGILIREKKGHSFLYTPIMEREEFLNYAISKVIKGLSNDYQEHLSLLSSEIAIPPAKLAKSRRKHKKKEP